eukprot:1929450-Prymnesium_polylepis.2
MEGLTHAALAARAGFLRVLESDISVTYPTLASVFFYASPKYIHIDYWFIGCLVRTAYTPGAPSMLRA